MTLHPVNGYNEMLTETKEMNDLESLAKKDEAWICSFIFRRTNIADIEVCEPDREFSEKIYTERMAQKLIDYTFDPIADSSLDEFVELCKLVGWDQLIACFGQEVLDASDIDRALGSLTTEIITFIEESAIPYLRTIN